MDSIKFFLRVMVAMAIFFVAIPTWVSVRAVEITRVSEGMMGGAGNGHSYNSAISADGRYVVFDSHANDLVENDTNYSRDVFLYDANSQVVERISVSSDGVQGNDGSMGPFSISSDGRYVVFSSRATNLVSGDTNTNQYSADVFVRDRLLQTTERVNVSSFGVQEEAYDTNYPPDTNSTALLGSGYSVAISDDGRYVAFTSYSRTLVPGLSTYGYRAFLRDRVNGSTELISSSIQTFVRDISSDGRYVALLSDSSLVSNDTNSVRDVYVFDRSTAIFSRESVSSSNIQANGTTLYASMSGDGRYVVFSSHASNLVGGDPNYMDVFMRDRDSGTTIKVSSGGNAHSGDAKISRDGNYVVFETASTSFSPIDSSTNQKIIIYNRLSGIKKLVSLAEGNLPANGSSRVPGVTNEGDFVIFASQAVNLVENDANNAWDVFLWKNNENPISVIGNMSQAFEGQAVTFSGQNSTDPDGVEDIVSYAWDFGDGTTGSGMITTHTYVDNGTYTATLTVTDAGSLTSSDSVMSTVNNSIPVVGTITAPQDPVQINVALDASAGFVDEGLLDMHSAAWDWGDGTTSAGVVTESSGSGSVTGSHVYSVAGQYVVTLTVTDNDGGSGTNIYQYVNVVSHMLTALDPLNIWVGLKNSDSVGIKFDLMAEVYKDTQMIGSGELNQVVGGSSGFNNARLNTIPLTLTQLVEVPEGAILGVKVYVRNTCYGNTHNSGFARLWYNDSVANSGFGTTIDGNASSHYLVNNFGLSPVVGVGPKLKIDVQSGAPCSAWKQFGTWTVSL